MTRYKAVRLNAAQIARPDQGPPFVTDDKGHPARRQGLDSARDPGGCWAKAHRPYSVPTDTELLFGECDESKPVCRARADDAVRAVHSGCPTWTRAIELALPSYEHGFQAYGSDSLGATWRQSRAMGREMDTTFVTSRTAPSTAGLRQLAGEGYLSFSIANPDRRGRDDAPFDVSTRASAAPRR